MALSREPQEPSRFPSGSECPSESEGPSPADLLDKVLSGKAKVKCLVSQQRMVEINAKEIFSFLKG